MEVSFGELTSDGHRVFTGFIRDISERKQAEDQLRASERDLQMTQAELVRVSGSQPWASWQRRCA